MKRIKLTEPVTFDLPHEDTILRVRMDTGGIKMWKRAVGNLDTPRAYDQFIEVSWKEIGNAGTCFAGSQSGHFQRGPASGRAGLNYIAKGKARKSRVKKEDDENGIQ